MPLTSDYQAHVRRAGDLLVASVYALLGFRVSWPLHAAEYDVLAESADGSTLLRVQVKTCTSRPDGAWRTWITRSQYAAVPGGKRRVAYAPSAVDVLAIVAGDLNVYLIPYRLVVGLSTVAPAAYEAFRVAGVSLAQELASP